MKGGKFMKKTIVFIFVCLILCCCQSLKQPEQATSTDLTKEETTLRSELEESPDVETTDPKEAELPSDLITITVYVPNDNADGFNTVEITGDKLSALDALKLAGVLPENIVINSYSWCGDTLTVDFGPEFRELINSTGTAGEYMIMGSVVNTLITLNHVTYVHVTVDGEILESGHVIYDFPMSFYE
jgi:hypothetical protein